MSRYGAATGGTDTGGAATGGTETGGTATGGTETGGADTGGTAAGGAAGQGGAGGSPSANLIQNGDLETGATAPWQANGGSIVLDTGIVHNGTSALRSTGRTATWNGPLQSLLSLVQSQQLASGDFILVTAWVQVSGAASDNVNVSLAITSGGSTAYITGSNVTASNTGWTQITQLLPVAWVTTPTAINFYFQGPASGVDIIVDDVVAIKSPSIVANGSFESGSASPWNGNGSTFSVQSGVVHSGTYAALATGRTATYQGPAQSILSSVSSGAAVSVIAWVQIPAGASASAATVNATLNLAGSGLSGSPRYIQLASTSIAVADQGTWVLLRSSSQVVLPTWTDALTTANLYFEGPAAGIDLYVDDVTLAVVPAG